MTNYTLDPVVGLRAKCSNSSPRSLKPEDIYCGACFECRAAEDILQLRARVQELEAELADLNQGLDDKYDIGIKVQEKIDKALTVCIALSEERRTLIDDLARFISKVAPDANWWNGNLADRCDKLTAQSEGTPTP